MVVSGRFRNFLFQTGKHQALFAFWQDAIKKFVSYKGVGNSFWQGTFDEVEEIENLVNLAGSQWCLSTAS